MKRSPAYWQKAKRILSKRDPILGRIIKDSDSSDEIVSRYESARIQRAHFVTEHSKRAGARFTGIDPEGCDLRVGGKVARILFKKPVTDFPSIRDALNELAGNKKTG